MKSLISAFALAAVIAGPAAAADMMTCAQFASLDDEQKLNAVERIEPDSVEHRTDSSKMTTGAQGDATRPSSGPDGTVDPSMLEKEKVAAVMGACHDQPNLPLSEAASAAFSKTK